MSLPPDAPTVVLTGGGTGGHIIPALAVAEALRRQAPHLRLLYVGGRDRMESRLVPERGLEFVGISIDGLQRRISLRNILRNLALPGKVIGSVASCLSLIRSRRVVGVVATGGYACLPMLVAARLRGIPYVLNEQNAFPGLVTRWMAAGAQRVYLGMSDAQKRLKIKGEQVRVTGNPVLTAAYSSDRETAKRALGFDAGPVVAVLGGSLGAATLNAAVDDGLDRLQAVGAQLFWQCGRQYADELMRRHEGRKALRIEAFVSNMAEVYAAADLVVCRAGALTLTELQVAGRPAVLIPSPNVTDDHQTHNAQALARTGMALVLPDAEAAERLVPMVVQLLTEPGKLSVLQSMAGAVQATLRLQPPAAEQIAADALGLFKQATV